MCIRDSTSTTAEIISALAGGDVLQDKDPYDGGLSVVNAAPTEARGNVVLTKADTATTPVVQKITLSTCYTKVCTGTSAKSLSTTVQIFE